MRYKFSRHSPAVMTCSTTPWIAIFAFFFTFTAQTVAQQRQRLEVFAGYAYSTQPPDVRDLPTKHLHGWRAAGTGPWSAETEARGFCFAL